LNAPPTGVTANIASHIRAMAASQPERPAIVAKAIERGWTSLSFAELDQKSDALAAGFEAVGIGRGVRTVVMVPPGLELFPLVFGLFKVGAVLVLIDPGIAKKALVSCLSEVEALAFIGVPRAQVARLVLRSAFRKVKGVVTVGRRLGWGGHTLAEVEALGRSRTAPLLAPEPGETAAILYTSGSTGMPKGAVYTHEMFDAQVKAIRSLYGITPGEIDLPTFPLFALFDPALGMTSVLPDMDYRFPARADPAKLVDALTTYACTNMFGSPALLDALGRYGALHGVKLPHLRRVLSAGAPVRTDVLERITTMLSGDAEVFTPFGATESLPVASIGSREVLRETRDATRSGKGVCVGRPAPGVKVRVIGIRDTPIEAWSDDVEVKAGTVGEITVRGDVVTKEYFARPDATKLAKIREGEAVVHRMGDVGYFDDQGRLWMCGRKSHRVEAREGVLFSTPVEEVLNAHPGVHRSALVGIGLPGDAQPVVLVERESGYRGADRALLEELRALAKNHDSTRRIDTFVLYPHPFPVDTRHNAKIEREKLAAWAATHVKGKGS
jgi:olefin beta-lactone synthetase